MLYPKPKIIINIRISNKNNYKILYYPDILRHIAPFWDTAGHSGKWTGRGVVSLHCYVTKAIIY